MKHAGTEALGRLNALLESIRKHEELTEKSRGTFYLRLRAVLHFHEDPAGLFADLRTAGDWERFPVNTAAERAELVRRLSAWLAQNARQASGPMARRKQI